MSYDSFFTTITWLGSLYFILPSSTALGLLLLRSGRMQEVLMLTLSLTATVLTVHTVKLIIRRPRPDSLELLVQMPADWSFPSAHTAQATAFFLVVALIALRSLPLPTACITAAVSALVIVGVGWSRVYLQVHYLSDVLAGFLLAVLLVAAIHFLLPHFHFPNGK